MFLEGLSALLVLHDKSKVGSIEGGGTSDLVTSAFFHMSNSPGVVGLCTTRFD